MPSDRLSPVPPVARREIVAWAMFDFANSSYTTIIVSFFFSNVFIQLIAAGPDADFWWGRATGLANLIVFLLSPLVGAIADESGRKKGFLFATYATCVAATAALWLVQPGQILPAFVLFVVSNIAFSFGENFAGAFLPEISTPANVGRISGFGWGLGYFGGLLSLALVFPLVRGGITLGNFENLRRVWPVTAAFFLVAALPTFLILRERATRRREPFGYYLRNGFGRLGQTVRAARTFRELARFLAVFFVFSIGLTAIIAFFGVYAVTTLGFTPTEMVLLGALLQVPSALGAVTFGLLQDRLGARRTLQAALLLWIAVSATTALVDEKRTFWFVAMAAGLGIGSLQAASRALVGLFSPVDKSGEFFGLWGLAGKGAYALGPLLFGWISSASGSQRTAALVNGGFFVAGLLGMFLVDEQRGRAAAAAWNGRREAPGPR
ncbi:MAG: MFS transporter [Thermoanaerobaculia bacterium]|nr:MAG: MFS transporter [Thermoanaerobaculia bacterium]